MVSPSSRRKVVQKIRNVGRVLAHGARVATGRQLSRKKMQLAQENAAVLDDPYGWRRDAGTFYQKTEKGIRVTRNVPSLTAPRFKEIVRDYTVDGRLQQKTSEQGTVVYQPAGRLLGKRKKAGSK